MTFAWWIFCMVLAAVAGGVIDHYTHTCPQPRPPTDRVNIQDHCGCVRWVVVGRRVPFKAPCPAHMVLDEMARIVDAEDRRLHSPKGHHS